MNKFSARLLSAVTAAILSASLTATAFADTLTLDISYSELDPADIEPEETEPDDVDPELEPEPDPEPETPEETEPPIASLDDETTTAAETTAPPAETTAQPAGTTAAAQAPTETTPLPTYIPEDPHTMYAPEVINVRRGPNTNFDKLGVLYVGTEITVIGSSGDWSAISYNGGIGYVMSALLSAQAPQTTTTATAAPEAPAEAPEETSENGVAEVVPPDEVQTETTTKEPEAETSAPEAEPETSASTTKAASPAGTTDKNGGGLPPIIPALLGAIAAFFLVGVLPVLIHKVHHKNLYRY